MPLNPFRLAAVLDVYDDRSLSPGFRFYFSDSVPACSLLSLGD